MRAADLRAADAAGGAQPAVRRAALHHDLARRRILTCLPLENARARALGKIPAPPVQRVPHTWPRPVRAGAAHTVG